MPLQVGQVRRHRLLGSTALYRVLDLTGPTVSVEAVRVPGLEPGTRIRLMRGSVGAMEPIAESTCLEHELEATIRRWSGRAA
jgi:hypothetical protein